MNPPPPARAASHLTYAPRRYVWLLLAANKKAAKSFVLSAMMSWLHDCNMPSLALDLFPPCHASPAVRPAQDKARKCGRSSQSSDHLKGKWSRAAQPLTIEMAALARNPPYLAFPFPGQAGREGAPLRRRRQKFYAVWLHIYHRENHVLCGADVVSCIVRALVGSR